MTQRRRNPKPLWPALDRDMVRECPINLGLSPATVDWRPVQILRALYPRARMPVKMRILHPEYLMYYSIEFEYGNIEDGLSQLHDINQKVTYDQHALFWDPEATAEFDVEMRDMWKVVQSMPSVPQTAGSDSE